MPARELSLVDVATGAAHVVVPRRLLVAGFTGREQDEVRRHVEELRTFGVPAPDATPLFFDLDPGLLTTSDAITVNGAFTSGEVEPVVVVDGTTRLLTVGSDHTDREIERESLAASKRACPKVIGRSCIAVDVVSDWDALELISWVDRDHAAYQQGLLRALLSLDALLGHLDADLAPLADGDVLFMGTVPITGGQLRASGHFRGALRAPDGQIELTVDYRITQRTERR